MLPVKHKLINSPESQRKVVPLTKKRIEVIESSSHLLTVEKVNLLALLLGHKQVTDIAVDEKDKSSAAQLLETLGLPSALNYYIDPDGVRHEWLQVAINKPTLDYVLERREELTVLEAGVLYGYPSSACLAYIGFLEQAWFDKTLAEYFLSGVFSVPYVKTERQYFERVWVDITEASPGVATQARAEYQEAIQSLAS
ncbi:hypothetical protein [Streptomyces griseorubiginosus]|uniref:hypothetical protein n=1 Tax=Streptomyces griseorubiginosus TaxID=67304 RepID=UPI002E80ECE9|nr:hypothetical protein [Streptomyces griseorubiginosus]WUB46356.1 hypothetical protein OHN19_24690 [Streptomyces griseorubiginosus]WUB54877.1 hypothetical protein OG942_24695 [Streptomyces griseorubiginosus]